MSNAAQLSNEATVAPVADGYPQLSETDHDLAELRFNGLASAYNQRAGSVAEFQHHVLRGRDIRSAVNCGERDRADLMDLPDRAQVPFLAQGPTVRC